MTFLNMFKIKSSVRSRLRSIVNEFGNNIFLTNYMVVLCEVCNITVVSEKKFMIQRHIS